jgi:hypothetical protein
MGCSRANYSNSVLCRNAIAWTICWVHLIQYLRNFECESTNIRFTDLLLEATWPMRKVGHGPSGSPSFSLSSPPSSRYEVRKLDEKFFKAKRAGNEIENKTSVKVQLKLLLMSTLFRPWKMFFHIAYCLFICFLRRIQLRSLLRTLYCLPIYLYKRLQLQSSECGPNVPGSGGRERPWFCCHSNTQPNCTAEYDSGDEGWKGQLHTSGKATSPSLDWWLVCPYQSFLDWVVGHNKCALDSNNYRVHLVCIWKFSSICISYQYPIKFSG